MEIEKLCVSFLKCPFSFQKLFLYFVTCSCIQKEVNKLFDQDFGGNLDYIRAMGLEPRYSNCGSGGRLGGLCEPISGCDCV